MSLYKGVPVFLSSTSDYNKGQVDYINIIVRTLRRSFESKAKQKQKDAPKISHLAVSKYGRVLDLKDYFYLGYFSLSFILNPANFINGQQYGLFETKRNLTRFTAEGSHSDTTPTKSLGQLGHIVISKSGDTNIVSFVPDHVEDWPKDSNNNMLNYSVYFSGEAT